MFFFLYIYNFFEIFENALLSCNYTIVFFWIAFVLIFASVHIHNQVKQNH